MIINKLKVEGFKIIGNPLEIEFPKEGIIGITGRNEVGKSSLLNAIEYALYGLRKGKVAGEAREDVISWGKKECRLEIEFTVQDNRYRIVRVFNKLNKNKVELYQINEDGKELVAKKLKEAERFIEDKIGMDRESFSKILYIKQNELDALKNLSKSNREALINKMVGIEIYDKAIKKIKDDKKALYNKLDILREKAKSIKKIYDRYLEKKRELSQAKKLEPNLTVEVEKLENKLSEVRSKIKIYELKENTKSRDKLLKTKQQEINNYKNSMKKLDSYQKLFIQYKDEVNDLRNLIQRYREIEGKMENLEESIKTKKEELEKQKIGVKSLKEEDLLDISKKKRRYEILLFLYFIGWIIILAVSSSLLSSLLVLPEILFVYLFLKYSRLASKYSLAILILNDIRIMENEKESIKEKEVRLSKKYKYKDAEKIKAKIDEINYKIKGISGLDDIEKLGWEVSRLDNIVKNVDISELNNEVKDIKNEIKELNKQINDLEEELGFQVKISKSEHSKLKKRESSLSEEYRDKNKELIELKQNLKTWSKDLKALEADYHEYPKVIENIEKIEKDIEIKEKLISLIKEASASLRQNVIPRAEIAINRILPDITEDRYSDLSISEDLKFKVYSVDAGGYKDKEVFSGGTQDQFLIALRLAFTESLLDLKIGSDRYCLIMDECIASSDEVRRRNIFDVVKMMRKIFSQIFIVAHIDISSFVDHILKLERDSRGYTIVSRKSW